MNVGDGTTKLERDRLEMRLATLFPTVSDDPLEAFMTVMNVRLQPLELAQHFSANACLNVLTLLGIWGLLLSDRCLINRLYESSPVHFQLTALRRTGTFARLVAWKKEDSKVSYAKRMQV